MFFLGSSGKLSKHGYRNMEGSQVERNKEVKMRPEDMAETRLFPQHPLFWAMLNEFRFISVLPWMDESSKRWWMGGYKWGWYGKEMTEKRR